MGPLIRTLVAAGTVAAVAVVALLALGRSSTGPSVDPTAVLSARAELAPQTVAFGDPVTARVTVTADRAVIDMSRIRVVDDLAPLTVLGPPRMHRSSLGRTGVLSIETPVVCLAEQCTGTRGLRLLQLRPVRIEARRSGGGAVAATAVWPGLTVRSRVLAADLGRTVPRFRADPSLPPTSLRVAPATLAAIFDVLAAILAALAVGLAARRLYLGRSRRRAAATQWSELERAVSLARESESRPASDRRRAVGLLARLLRDRRADLSGRADDLAWSSAQPTPEAVSELIRDVLREPGR